LNGQKSEKLYNPRSSARFGLIMPTVGGCSKLSSLPRRSTSRPCHPKANISTSESRRLLVVDRLESLFRRIIGASKNLLSLVKLYQLLCEVEQKQKSTESIYLRPRWENRPKREKSKK
jgi:hypothetical protein